MRITLLSGTPAEIARVDDAAMGLVICPDIGGLRPLFDDHVARLSAETRAGRVGVIGFCMGGMYALKAAGTGRFDRAVAFYGMIRVPAQFRGPGHAEPLDAVARSEACPVLAIIGGQDPWTPADDVDALRAAGAEIALFPDADHGFVHDPDRPAHRADDAADAWRRAITFLSS